MKLTSTTWVSLDGVMQGLGDEDEDRRGGFERGGWAMPLSDPEVESELNAVYAGADAFLFGRWTFEVFAGSWGTVPEMKDSEVGEALNSKPKYVVSNTIGEPKWENTTVLAGNASEAVRDLKSETDGTLLLPGSRTLAQSLFEEALIDEINLFVAPVVIGQGTRLFPDSGRDARLELAESRSTSNGVLIQTYLTDGRPQYGRTAQTTDAWSE